MGKANYIKENYLPVNECDIITIYPMGVQCFPISPLKENGTGSLVIKITGGTPPYQVNLLNPISTSLNVSSNSVNIPNLRPNTYFLEVTDQFGDFQQVINCTIIAPSPPPPSPTPVPPIPLFNYVESSFCLDITIKSSNFSGNKNEQLFFYVQSFTTINNVSKPIWGTSTGDETVYYNTSTSNWTLSASSSSVLTNLFGTPYNTNSGWQVINTSTINTIPLNNGLWTFIPPVSLPTGLLVTTTATNSSCKSTGLVLFFGESWFQTNSTLPLNKIGSTCGGWNQTPWIKWVNRTNRIVLNYEILCTNLSNGDTYFNVINISPNQTQVGDTVAGQYPWLSSPTILPTTGFGAQNSQGWAGPCVPPLTPFELKLTANMISGAPLISKIYFK